MASNQIRIAVSETIDARPEDVYAVLADYREGHPAILPKQYFTELTVEEGGTGAGTRILVRMKVFGVENTYRMVVSEPEPGRVLVEADDEADVVTTFTVGPLDSGSNCRLTIETSMRSKSGIGGFFERLFTPMISRRIYNKELSQIADYMRNKSG